MSRYITCQHEQGTDGWRADRLGLVTGSVVSAVFATVKSGEAAGRANLRMDLLLERITGKSTPGFAGNADMAWGTEQEPFARMAYEKAKGLDVSESGFLYLPTIKAGCSLDGQVMDGQRRGILEIKCPKSATHYKYLLSGKAPTEYLPQITHNLWITGDAFTDFMSFDPRMPVELQQFHIRIERDEAAIQAHAAGVMQFLMELDADEKKMRALIAERQAELATETETEIAYPLTPKENHEIIRIIPHWPRHRGPLFK